MSAEFTITGRYAYGLMTGERGTHRLVRISPFDNQGRRQTSFAGVQVWPVMDALDLEVNDADIRMEVFRASGAGGQHVNKTSSAVRLIHEPTGLVASSQEERSQLQNREKAMNRLRTMIAAKIEEEREAELDSIAGRQAQVGWGSQIRSYVVQPYQMVKDLRTEVESSNVTARARRRHRRVHGGLPAVATAGSGVNPLVFAELRAGRRLQHVRGETPMIRLENVTKTYSTEVVALRDASFDVAKAEFVFLVGPSGFGQEHAAAADEPRGAPREGLGLGRRAEHQRDVRQQGAAPAPQHRQHLPGLQAAAATRPCTRTSPSPSR